VNTYLYVISCPLGLVKVGVAADPKQRVRNLQIGSPVPLELAAQYEISDLASAKAVEAALKERFLERRERGHWFRATASEVHHTITERSIIDLYRPSEAKARAAARAAEEQARAEAAKASAAVTVAERRRLRQERRLAAARLLAAGKTQVATARALGVTDRTIRNWAKAKSFQTALRRAREQAARQAARAAAKERTRANRNARRRYWRQNPDLFAAEKARRPELRSPFEQQPAPDRKPKPKQQPTRPGRVIRIDGGLNW